MDSVVAEVKAKNDIIDVISQYMTLKKAGRQYTGLCPFHQEKSPSFYVSAERQMWYCFGACHEGGDVISFVMKIENIGFYEALKELAQRAGVQLRDVRFQDREWERKEILYTINRLACDYYKYILKSTKIGEVGRDYLRRRQLNDKIIDTFEIGYAPNSWDSLLNFLLKKKFSREDIARTGLIVKSEHGSAYYDRFRGRIMFPLRDVRDNIIGFSGRVIGESKEAKYINVPETEIYRKRESLYGIHITKDKIRAERSVILVEGEFDVIGPYQQGFGNIVAIKGSSVTKDHLRILKRYTTRIILSLDADAAGRDAVVRAIKESEEMDLEVYVMRLTGGKDPDEVVRNQPLAFKEAIRNAIPAYDFLLQEIHNKYPHDSPFDKKHAVNELVEFLHLIKNPVVLSHYIKLASEMFDVDREILKEVLARYVQKIRRGTQHAVSRKPGDAGAVDQLMEKQRTILKYIFHAEKPLVVARQLFTNYRPEDFSYPALITIAKALEEYAMVSEEFEINTFIGKLEPQLHPMVDELYVGQISEDALPIESFAMYALNVKALVLKQRLKELNKKNDSGEFDDKLRDIAKELDRITKLRQGNW